MVTLRSPYLLTVDYPLVAVEHCRGFEAGQVASAIWFAEALTPAHLSAKNLWKKLFLLLFGSPLQQRWANQSVAEEVGAHWCFCVCKLFCKHHTLQCVQAFAAVFLRPRCANPAAFEQFVRPLCIELLAFISGEFKTFVEPALRQIGDKPRFHFFTEGFCLGCVSQHASILPRGARFSPYEAPTDETMQRHTGSGLDACSKSYSEVLVRPKIWPKFRVIAEALSNYISAENAIA